MSFAARAAAVLLALGAAAGAGAQIPPKGHEIPLGSRIPVPVPTPSPAEQQSLRASARILQAFSHCVVNRNEALFAAIVAVPPIPTTSAPRAALFSRANRIMSHCLTRASQMTANASLMVGAFAEQLYRHRFSSVPTLAAASVAPADNPDDVILHATLAFANCLIDRNGGGVDAVLRTIVGSDGEDAAFAVLSPSYATCVDSGSTLRLNQVSLRSALADQLYRRALAAAGGA